MRLTTTCPWCGKDGFRASFRDNAGNRWHAIARDSKVAVHRESDGDYLLLEGPAAEEKITEMIGRAEEECGNPWFTCQYECRSTAGELIDLSRTLMLLNRITHGHAGSARDRIQQVEAAP